MKDYSGYLESNSSAYYQYTEFLGKKKRVKCKDAKKPPEERCETEESKYPPRRVFYLMGL